jgi:hypothetical protein
MRDIKNIILRVASRFLYQTSNDDRHDNWDKSPYYQDISKEELKLLSDYIVNENPDIWDEYWDETVPKTIFTVETSTMMRLISKELDKIKI